MLLGFLTLSLSISSTGYAQFGGNARMGNSGYGSNNETIPSQRELSKRELTAAELKDDGNATFIEASVLMNVKADEYVAVFGLAEEAPTVAEANTKFDAMLTAFKAALAPLGIAEKDMFVDFVAQNRIYSFEVNEANVREVLSGFQLKKNVSIRFRDKSLVDRLVQAAAQAKVYDVVKVDYIVHDIAAIQERLQVEAARIIKQKIERQRSLLGIELSSPMQVTVDKPSIYYPLEQYSSYTASEEQSVSTRDDRLIQRERRSRTFYFDPLNADLFDTVIDPVIVEPVVQFTAYMRVKCETGKLSKKRRK